MRITKSATVRVNTGNYEFVEYTASASITSADMGWDGWEGDIALLPTVETRQQLLAQAVDRALRLTLQDTIQEIEAIFPGSNTARRMTDMGTVETDT